MKARLLCFLFLSFSLSICAANQSEPLPSYGLLWKITGNGLEKPSYLFGTFHGRGGMQILDSIKGLDSIFNTTDQFLCESRINFANINNSENSYTSNKLDRQLKPWPVVDSTYDNILSISQKKVLDSVLLSDKMLTYIKPLNYRPLMLMSSIKFSYSDLHKKPAIKYSKDYKPNDTTHVFLDLYLDSRAMKRNMKIVALDLKDEYRKLIDSLYCNLSQISYSAEVDLMMYYIENHSAMDSTEKTRMAKAISYYLNQDIRSMLSQNENHVKEPSLRNNPIQIILGNEYSEKYVKLMIDQRNSNWMKKIPDYIVESSCFIAVGAAHLAGENGLINQLRVLGYYVNSFQEK